MLTRYVNFVWSHQPLLSGGLDDCVSIDDETCSAGVAGVRAYLRAFVNKNTTNPEKESTLWIPLLDYQSAFVQMHPLSWGVNRLILQERFGLDTFFCYTSLVGQDQDSQVSVRDLRSLQTNQFLPLLGNKVVASSSPWGQYVQDIHFDPKTSIVVIPIDNPNGAVDELNGSVRRVPQVDAARGLLNYIFQLNQENPNCRATAPKSIYEDYLLTRNFTAINSNENDYHSRCWIPMIAYEHTIEEDFDAFLAAMQVAEHPPAVIAQVRATDNRFSNPVQVAVEGSVSKIWLVSHVTPNRDLVKHIRLSVDDETATVTDVEFLEYDMGRFGPEIADDQLASDIDFIAELAQEARTNNPIQGYSLEMPRTVNPDDIAYKACYGGECPLGNLFADALRWKTDSDVAFVNSGGIRGQGWPEGPVRVSNLWEALPFANTQCSGMVSGVTLFRIFDYATTYSNFTYVWQPQGDRLFQVSGVRYTYNAELEAPRLVGLEVWDKDLEAYEPVERLKLYKFATSSWMCFGFDMLPELLSETGLTMTGEVPKSIGDQLLQFIVGDYLSVLDTPYDTSYQGRLVNDATATREDVLDFVETEAGCNTTTYWIPDIQTCWPCPNTDKVLISSREANFFGESKSDRISESNGKIENGENFVIEVVLKSAPTWVSFPAIERATQGSSSASVIEIQPGSSFSFDYRVSAKNLDVGIATGPISFAVLDGGSFPGCVGRDATFDVSMRVGNAPELIEPQEIQIVGFTLVSIITVTAAALALWVYTCRNNRVVKALQPTFLLVLCFGIWIMGLSVIPLSIHGMDISDQGQNMACMATPWLLSMGFTIVMSTLFSKLWRINKLFGQNGRFRRMTIQEREALVAFGILFFLNTLLMLIWNLVDPMTYELNEIEDEEWKLYGSCNNMGTVGWTFLGLTAGLNFFALVMACFEAYKARNISEDYSESKSLGLAMFSWTQILLVAAPMLFLIEEDNVNPRYYLQVAVIFVLCLSMLMIIFVPIIAKARTKENKKRKSRISGIGLSGFSSFSLGEMQSYLASKAQRRKSMNAANVATKENAESQPQAGVSPIVPRRKTIQFENPKLVGVDTNPPSTEESSNKTDLEPSKNESGASTTDDETVPPSTGIRATFSPTKTVDSHDTRCLSNIQMEEDSSEVTIHV